MEDKILKLITSEQSWEQVIYEIVAWEGLDPWDLDISALSTSFIKHIEKAEDFDFKVPAKYVIIAAILLRMKSDHLDFIEVVHRAEDTEEELETEIDLGEQPKNSEINKNIMPLELPPRRLPQRRLVVNDLIFALRNAMRTETRKSRRNRRAAKKIDIGNEDIMEKISTFYRKIDVILAKIKEEEIKFSNIVNKWEKNEIIDTFLPLVYLDNEKKVVCRQENIFDEIFVSKRTN